MTERKNSYPNAFRFGFTAGVFLQLCARRTMEEPFAARPFSYLRTGLLLGFTISYWDYFRRVALQEVMYTEQKMRYH